MYYNKDDDGFPNFGVYLINGQFLYKDYSRFGRVSQMIIFGD